MGLSCGALAATQINALTSSAPLQTALSYYLKEPGVRPMHVLAFLLDFLMVAWVALWLFIPRRAILWQLLLLSTAIVAGGLVWLELYRATVPDASRVYVLDSLPFRPVNNFGLVGAGVFFGYITLKLPVGRLSTLPAVLVRFALAFSVLGLQWMLYDALSTRLS